MKMARCNNADGAVLRIAIFEKTKTDLLETNQSILTRRSEVLQEIQSLQTEDTDLANTLENNQTVISNIEKFFKKN